MTLWSPDTCGCQIEISDDPLTLGQSVRHVKICQAHSNLGYGHAKVLAENQLKNRSLDDAQTALSKPVDWSIASDTRQVVLTAGNISTKQKTDLQTLCDTKYGVGAVKIA